MSTKQALGKGLSALIDSGEDDLVVAERTNETQEIDIAYIKAGSYQPRTHFDEESLKELADSIKANGVIQPIIVRELKKNSYEIIAGERRYRAAKIAGLSEVPVIIKDIGDKQALEIALIENIQRENLTPIEEADAYKRLQAEFDYTQEQTAAVLGKSRSHVANILRLLTLPASVKNMVNNGQITMGHARVLVGMGAEEAERLANMIVADNLNVREAEKFASGSGHAGGGVKGKAIKSGNKTTKAPAQKDEDLIALENSLTESIGVKVSIEDDANGGRVILHFNNLTELDAIIQKMS